MNTLVSVAIINWNGEKYLYKCIKSLLNQSYKNIEIILIDNDSTDNSVEVVTKNFRDKVKIIRNSNTGYAGGANKGIQESQGEYIVIANPDVVFSESYIDTIIIKMEKDSKVVGATGKLLKYDFDNDKIINVIDSVGISLNHSRQGIDIGQNDIDNGQYEEDKVVFGVCGAAAVFKRKALEKIKIKNEYFDNDFFAYKEDIDICWRINLYGYKNIYIHDAIAYHGRGMNSSKGLINTIKNRRNQSQFLKGISFRNHYLMLIKNETSYSFKKDRFKIYLGFLKYIIFFLFFDQGCLKFISQIIDKKDIIKEKREIILKNIKLSHEEIYKLFDL